MNSKPSIDSVRVVRYGQTINVSERLSVVFGDFDGWIYGKHAIKALRQHRLFMRSDCRKKRRKWMHAVEKTLRQARNVRNVAY